MRSSGKEGAMTDNWYSDEAATFGDRLTAARERAGLTQSELAARVGVRLATLAKWEDDLSEPRANRLQMLSGMLGVSLIWLLTGEGDGPEEPPAEGGAENGPDVADMLEDVRALRAAMLAMAGRIGQLEKRLRGYAGNRQ